MKKIKHSLILLLVLISINKLRSQNLDLIVKKIAEINEIQFKGQSGKYPNFENFELLKNKANTGELINLLDNKNAVVAGYASLGLIDKNYNQIEKIFTKLLVKNETVTTLGGCLIDEEEVPAVFYNYFIFESKLSEVEKNKTISKLDSIVIYNGNSNHLLHKILEEKKFNSSYNQQIKHLAYQKYNQDALIYISNWKIETDKEILKKAWLTYIDKIEISNNYLGFYYNTVEKLLEFKDDEINARILSKLIKNKESWEYDKEKFELLFSEYNLKID